MVYSLVAHISTGLIATALFFGSDTYFTYQLGLYLLYALAAQGLGFCWGKTGILPLGNAVFFGTAAYLSGYVLKNFDGSILLLLLPICALIPSLFAFGLARVLLRKTAAAHSLFFALITMALSMLAFLIANSWNSITGGFNGMLDIPSIGNLDNIDDLFWLILPISILVSFGLFYISKSPFGVLLKSCADSELRIKFLGFSTATLKSMAFAISALCAAIAGVLYAPHQGIVTPQSVGFLLSVEFIIWCALGGRKSVYGPLIGVLLVGFLASELRDIISYWEVVIALLFILVVLYSPDGMIGIISKFGQAIKAKLPNLSSTKDRDNVTKLLMPKRQNPDFKQLQLSNLNLAAGGNRILVDLNLTLDKPAIYALIGPNGAGKTTVFNAITRHLDFQTGKIMLNDVDISKKTTEFIITHNLSRKFQTPNVFDSLNIRDNLLIAVWSKRLSFINSFSLKPLNWHSELVDQVLARFEFLQDKYRTLASNLSQGEKQMLEFAMIVCSEPNLMLLDEPCAGLSPAETQYMVESIKIFATKLNSSVLMIEHDMDAVKKNADTVLVLHKGSLFFSGTMAEVQNSSKVKSIYSGGHK